ncbi:MAG: glycosyltransferase family 2 protein [Ignavibacteria bacterium]|nr:glycosyltransferase family 2 protein [Ignavibacteria bacterium]
MITVIIPNYNGVGHLRICLPSLKKQTVNDFRLIVIDNGSTDSSVDYILSQFPECILIKKNYNSGFASAVNDGIKKAFEIENSAYILLLNNDIELKENFLEVGLKTFREFPDISSVAVKMLNYQNREIIDDCGDFIKKNGGSPFARGHGEKDIGQYDKSEYIFGACAGAAFYKTDLFRKVGLFDEDFFAYYEDIDFSFRAQLTGRKCLYQPEAVCYHIRGGTSSVATYGFQTEMCERNLVIMRFKNYPLSLYILYQPLFFLARMKRYYGFAKNSSLKIMLKAVRGYLRGLLKIPSKLSERIRIQKSRTISTKEVMELFSK